MKKTNLFFVLMLASSLAHGQTTDASSGTVDSTFSAAGKQLTDAEQKSANEFVHQGLKDEKIKEGCAQEALQGCNPSPTEEGVLFKGGLGAALENNISKLYTVVFGGMNFLGGGASKGADKAAAPVKEGAPAADAKKVKEKKTDYCIYGAMAGEVLAQGMQSTAQTASASATANLNDPQVAALASLKDTHKARRNSATLQSAVYGAVTACYAVRMFTGGPSDTMTIVKMGAAAGISALYKMKADKHSKAMKLVQNVIDGLPKAGDCNPYTGTSCFCSEKTSQTLYASQYQEVCVLNGGNAEGTLVNSGCTENSNGTVVYDASCSCKAKNTCYSTTVSTYNPKIPISGNFMNSANKGFDLVENGTFDQAALSSFSTAASGAFNKIKDKIDTSKVPKVALTDDQKKTAAELANSMPAAVAAIGAASASSQPQSGGLMDGGSAAALAKLPDTVKKKLEAVSGGYKTNGSGNGSNAVAEEPGFVMPKFGGEDSASENGSEVVNFANRAVDGAEVSNRPETPIFDIISNRYRSSGWNRVQISE